MKKVISIFFLAIYLFATSEAYQLVKTPLLFEHYHAHKMADKGLTIWGFIYEHYFNCSQNDPDYKADLQLPFKSHSDCIAGNIDTLKLINHKHQAFNANLIVTINRTDYQLYKQLHFIYPFLSAIWQPPKV